MAGLASTFTFKPFLSKPNPLSLPYQHSTLFTLRLRSPTFFLSTSSTSTAISARYGGRRPRDYDDDDDEGLDISVIRSQFFKISFHFFLKLSICKRMGYRVHEKREYISFLFLFLFFKYIFVMITEFLFEFEVIYFVVPHFVYRIRT